MFTFQDLGQGPNRGLSRRTELPHSRHSLLTDQQVLVAQGLDQSGHNLGCISAGLAQPPCRLRANGRVLVFDQFEERRDAGRAGLAKGCYDHGTDLLRRTGDRLKNGFHPFGTPNLFQG